MLRFLDFLLASVGLILLFPFAILIYIAALIDTGSPLFFQRRVGKNQKAFTLVKFRTMRINTNSVATHLVSPASVTKLGAFLRRTKLDELPQLLNVCKGDMSLVGPRPCLYNQEELIAERIALDVFDSRPGITGLAQITGIDMSTPRLLAETDAYMLKTLNITNYFYYIFKTIAGSGLGDRIRQK